jgi:ketosteroid isomerase-like protein
MMPPIPPLASPDDLEAQFYEAMRRGDIEKMMAVWSDDEEVVCVHPGGGGRIVGAAAIRASFEAIFANGAVDAMPERVRRVQTQACAVHSVLERLRVRAANATRVAYATATNVYVRTALGWRMVAHHASPGIGVDDAESAEPPSTLH